MPGWGECAHTDRTLHGKSVSGRHRTTHSCPVRKAAARILLLRSSLQDEEVLCQTELQGTEILLSSEIHRVLSTAFIKLQPNKHHYRLTAGLW